MNLLLSDSRQRPELFHWNGPVAEETVRRWLRREHIKVPDDMVEFWSVTGGGDFFESETILSPDGNRQFGDELKTANSFHREHGLGPGLLLFHVGVTRTAIDQSTLTYIALHESYDPDQSFRSFNEWYYSIRRSFAETYGLTKLAVLDHRSGVRSKV